jgi:phosphoglycolate phosphatase
MQWPVPAEEKLRLFIGPPLSAAFSEICGMDDETAAEAVRCYREYYSAGGLLENTVYAGVPEMLADLNAAGERLVIATSKPEVFARKITDHFGLTRYFAFVGGALMHARKEKDEVLAYVLDTVGADPARCVMIGDRHYDVRGAKAFGMPAVGVLWGYGSREELTEAGAARIAGAPAEIKEILNDI